jgi:hydrogenase maturation factor
MCIPVVGRLLRLPGLEPGAVMDADGMAIIEEDGGRLRRVSLALLAAEAVPLAPGDWLRAHSGLALQRIVEEEARAEIAAWREMSGDGQSGQGDGGAERTDGGTGDAAS